MMQKKWTRLANTKFADSPKGDDLKNESSGQAEKTRTPRIVRRGLLRYIGIVEGSAGGHEMSKRPWLTQDHEAAVTRHQELMRRWKFLALPHPCSQMPPLMRPRSPWLGSLYKDSWQFYLLCR